jgi:hypothetical protein
MTDRKPPPEIWLDLRVAQTIPNEPVPEFDENQCRYFSADRVKELVDMARGGAEFIIQITTPPQSSAIFALTNYGRIFIRTSHDQGGQPYHSWKPVEGPDLGTSPNKQSSGSESGPEPGGADHAEMES